MKQDYLEEEHYLSAEKRVKEIKGFYIHLFWYLIVNIIWIIVLINSEEVPSFDEFGFWGMGYGYYATTVCWGIGIVLHFIAVYAKNIIFSKDWEERKIKKIIKNNNLKN